MVTDNPLMPILHYAFGLRFGKVCAQNASKNATKMPLTRVFAQSIV